MDFDSWEYNGEVISINFDVEENCGLGGGYVANICFATHEDGTDFTEDELDDLSTSENEALVSAAFDEDSDLMAPHPLADDRSWWVYKEG